MSTDDAVTWLILVTNVAGAIGFGFWMGHWGAGLAAFAITTVVSRAAS